MHCGSSAEVSKRKNRQGFLQGNICSILTFVCNTNLDIFFLVLFLGLLLFL